MISLSALNVSGSGALVIEPPYVSIDDVSNATYLSYCGAMLGTADFVGHSAAHLLAWCTAGTGAAVRAVTGQDGTGKSRLAREVCHRLLESGWAGGVLTSLRAYEDARPLPVDRPIVLVIEHRTGFKEAMAGLSQWLAARPDGAPAARVLVEVRTYPGQPEAAGHAIEYLEPMLAGTGARVDEPCDLGIGIEDVAERERHMRTAVTGYRRKPWGLDGLGRAALPDLDMADYRRLSKIHVHAVLLAFMSDDMPIDRLELLLKGDLAHLTRVATGGWTALSDDLARALDRYTEWAQRQGSESALPDLTTAYNAVASAGCRQDARLAAAILRHIIVAGRGEPEAPHDGGKRQLLAYWYVLSGRIDEARGVVSEPFGRYPNYNRTVPVDPFTVGATDLATHPGLVLRPLFFVAVHTPVDAEDHADDRLRAAAVALRIAVALLEAGQIGLATNAANEANANLRDSPGGALAAESTLAAGLHITAACRFLGEERTGALEAAQKAVERYRELDRKHPQRFRVPLAHASLTMGVCLLDAGLLDPANAALDDAAQMCGPDLDYHDRGCWIAATIARAHCLVRLRRPEDALDGVVTALEHVPTAAPDGQEVRGEQMEFAILRATESICLAAQGRLKPATAAVRAAALRMADLRDPYWAVEVSQTVAGLENWAALLELIDMPDDARRVQDVASGVRDRG